MCVRRIVIAAIAYFWLLPVIHAVAQSQKPADVHREFAGAAKKASSVDQIAGSLSVSLLKDMKNAPNEQQANWLKFMQDTWDMTELKFINESISGDRCTLDAAGKTAAAN